MEGGRGAEGRVVFLPEAGWLWLSGQLVQQLAHASRTWTVLLKGRRRKTGRRSGGVGSGCGGGGDCVTTSGRGGDAPLCPWQAEAAWILTSSRIPLLL